MVWGEGEHVLTTYVLTQLMKMSHVPSIRSTISGAGAYESEFQSRNVNVFRPSAW